MRKQKGFTYLWLIFMLAISAAGTAAVGELWSVQLQRGKELELADRGRQIVAALESYRAASPNSTPCAPKDWEQLLEDNRSSVVQRHLRRPYKDPFSPTGDWQLVKDSQGRMLGVQSTGATRPLLNSKAGGGLPTAGTFQISAAPDKTVCLTAPVAPVAPVAPGAALN